MSKPKDTTSLQRQLNRATTEQRNRAYTQASKTIREILKPEYEKKAKTKSDSP